MKSFKLWAIYGNKKVPHLRTLKRSIQGEYRCLFASKKEAKQWCFSDDGEKIVQVEIREVHAKAQKSKEPRR